MGDISGTIYPQINVKLGFLSLLVSLYDAGFVFLHPPFITVVAVSCACWQASNIMPEAGEAGRQQKLAPSDHEGKAGSIGRV